MQGCTMVTLDKGVPPRTERETAAEAQGRRNLPSKGEVVIIKSEEKNRAQWKLGVIEDLITGRDGVIRGAKLKSLLERPIQHLYPLELSCDKSVQTPPVTLKIVVVDLAFLIFDTEMSCGGKEDELIHLAAETKQGDLFTRFTIPTKEISPYASQG